MSDYKDRIRKAAEHAATKALKEYAPPTRRNAKPEKEVEKSCLELMRSWGWTVEIYESKATRDRNGVWRQQAMKAGTSDCMGCTNQGVAVAIEFKSPGKRSTLRESQRDFLISRINQFAFGCVVDSDKLLEEYRNRWEFLRKTGNLDASRDYLLHIVPKIKS